MKTAVIWNEIETLRYAVMSGDYRKYHGVYANMLEPDGFQPKGEFENLADQMLEDFSEMIFCSITEFAEAIRDGAHVVECGFLP